jgi:8-oxo-dGTP pyrophosphatase MutT (NUDIX family)
VTINTAVFFESLSGALHSTSTPPVQTPWNHGELIDLMPENGTTIRPAAVLIGLIERPSGLQLILTRRTEALRHHAGQISFPGGRIEASDHDPIVAAAREAHEEIGLLPEHIQALGYLDSFLTITGFHVYPVVAKVSADFIPRADPNEVDEIFEVPLDFLLNPKNAKLIDIEYRGKNRTIIEFQYQQYRIWGATASMLVNFRKRIEQAVPI